MHLLDDVQAAVDDELVHVPGLLAEARLAVPALLRRAELVLEERVVLRADDGEVVRHFFVYLSIICDDCVAVRSLSARIGSSSLRRGGRGEL